MEWTYTAEAAKPIKVAPKVVSLLNGSVAMTSEEPTMIKDKGYGSGQRNVQRTCLEQLQGNRIDSSRQSWFLNLLCEAKREREGETKLLRRSRFKAKSGRGSQAKYGMSRHGMCEIPGGGKV